MWFLDCKLYNKVNKAKQFSQFNTKNFNMFKCASDSKKIRLKNIKKSTLFLNKKDQKFYCSIYKKKGLKKVSVESSSSSNLQI